MAWWAAVAALAAACAFFRRHGLWTPYFASGAAGTALLGAAAVRGSGLEEAARATVSRGVYAALGAPRWLVPDFGTGTFLMVAPGGWASFRVDLECLGVLEVLVFAGLVVFYPLFSPKEKLWALLWGVPTLAALNLARTAMILLLVHHLGLDATRLAHTILGRMLFFAGAMLVYWQVFTRGTVAAYAGLGGRRRGG